MKFTSRWGRFHMNFRVSKVFMSILRNIWCQDDTKEKHMNIVVDTNASLANQGIEKGTTTYRPQAPERTTWGSGYSLDIADKVMDNGAYQGQGKTAQDIMQEAQATDVQTQKDFMVVMSNSVSGEDLQKMQEEGFSPGSTDVETYVSMVDKIKVTLAQAGVDIAGFTDDLDAETIQEIVGSRIDVNALIKSLKQADLPVTRETILDYQNTRQKADEIEGLSEDALKFMILNKKAPTIENLYIAQFSSAKTLKQASGYYAESFGQSVGYFARKAESLNWENIKGQIEDVIEEANLPNTKETKEQAKWLILSGIECNKENLTQLSQLQSIEFPISQETLIDVTIKAIQNGKQPQNALLTGESSIQESAQKVMEDVEQITDAGIYKTVEENKPVTIQNLVEASKETETVDFLQDTENIEALEAKRQLEEIRLMMTIDANKQLIKKGMQIDVTPLSELVEKLKETVDNLKAKLYQGGNVEENTQREQLYEKTLFAVEDLKQMPANMLGIHKNIEQVTLEKLHETGKALQKDYEKAGETYEALKTEPRADLGDKITKAFRNIDDILKDLGLEATKENQRAVRILAYNSMEITKEQIAAVKQADQTVQQVMKRMNPAKTLEMIRDDKNPLEMSLSEINEYLDERQSEEGHSEEKFAKFLQKLDRKHGISESERKAYMGIYRMFRQIEKSDGAVIGNLIATKADINFKNMLSAVRSAHVNLDVRIDEEYGALEELIVKNTSISGDINQAFEQTLQSEQYYGVLAGEITQNLSSKNTVEDLQEIKVTETTTIEAFGEELSKKITPQKEQDYQKQQVQEDFTQFREDVKNASQMEEKMLEHLMELDIPISIDHIHQAHELMFQGTQFFHKVAGNSKKTDTNVTTNNEQTEEEVLDELTQAGQEVIEAFTDASSAKKSYESMITKAKQLVEKRAELGKNAVDLKACQSICKTLSFANKLAKKESYEIPVSIKGELTAVHLEIYHDYAEKGKISITMEHESLGKVAAELSAGEASVQGMMVYENRMEKQQLEEIQENMKQEMTGMFGKDFKVNVSLVQTNEVDFYSFGQEKDMDSALSTKELYDIAKCTLRALAKEK